MTEAPDMTNPDDRSNLDSLVAEGAGATPVAAALSGRAGNGKLACVVSGGNLDPAKLATILSGGIP